MNNFNRPAGGIEIHNKSDGTITSNWFIGLICHRDICYYWSGILLGSTAQDLLQSLRYW